MQLEITIRLATESDLDLIHSFITQKFEFDGFAHPLEITIAQLQQTLFGSPPLAQVLLAEVEQVPMGFLLFSQTYSSFLAQPTLWMDDLFVPKHMRDLGIGTALLRKLAEIAQERGCGRLEWTVATGNAPAIDFYQKHGAQVLQTVRLCRVALASSVLCSAITQR
jgi:GNAT superfamily N-acetyltransferase